MKNSSARTARRLLLRLSGRLFAADDAAARRQGWQISSRWGGWARSYRDPRFDSLAAREPGGRPTPRELAGRWR